MTELQVRSTFFSCWVKGWYVLGVAWIKILMDLFLFFFFVFSSIWSWVKWSRRGILSGSAPHLPCQLSGMRFCWLRTHTMLYLFQQGLMEMAQCHPWPRQGCHQQLASGRGHKGLNVSEGGDLPSCLGLNSGLPAARALSNPGRCPPQIRSLFLLLAGLVKKLHQGPLCPCRNMVWQEPWGWIQQLPGNLKIVAWPGDCPH